MISFVTHSLMFLTAWQEFARSQFGDNPCFPPTPFQLWLQKSVMVLGPFLVLVIMRYWKGKPSMSTTNQKPATSTKRHQHLSWLIWLAGVVLLVDAIRTILQTMSQSSAVPFSDWVK